MAVTTQPLSRVKTRMDARHLMRYLRFKAGTTPEAIAREDHVTVKIVKESIREMERFEQANSEGQVSLHIRNMVISMLPKVQETLGGLLEATNTVKVPNPKTGKIDVTYEPDKITRLEALRVAKGMIETTIPKVPQVVTNVNQTNQTAVLSSAETPEERMRRLKIQAAEHNLLPPVVAAVPVAIDRGFDQDEDEDE